MTLDDLNEVLRNPEATWLDWKRDFPRGLSGGKRDPAWDAARGEIMKDLVAIANGDDNRELGFLVYGVEDLGTRRDVIGMSTRGLDDATFQTWSENTFDPPPRFTYSEVSVSASQTVGVFAIRRVSDFPHVVKTTLGGIAVEGQVWFRRGTKNTIAKLEDLRRMIRGHEPFRFAHLGDPQLKELEQKIRAEGWEPVIPLLIEKDSCMVGGYQVVHYPGTRREVWIGRPGEEMILMRRRPNP